MKTKLERFKYLMTKKDFITLSIDSIYKTLIFLAITIFLFLAIFLLTAFANKDFDTIVKLLVPMGVLVSAGLASASVMKSIENTNRIENEKREKENEKIKAKLTFYLIGILICRNFIPILKDHNKAEGFKTFKVMSKQMQNSYQEALEKFIHDKSIISLQTTHISALFHISQKTIEALIISNNELLETYNQNSTQSIINLVTNQEKQITNHIISIKKEFDLDLDIENFS